jgi:hypothetical protein
VRKFPRHHPEDCLAESEYDDGREPPNDATGTSMTSYRVIAFLLSLVTTMPVSGQDKQGSAQPQSRPTALVEAAMKNRYTWSPYVAGVSGRIAWESDREQPPGAATFRCKIGEPPSFILENAIIPTEIHEHILSLMADLTPSPSSAAIGSSRGYAIMDDDPLRGTLIVALHDPTQTYRVKNGRLVETSDITERGRGRIGHIRKVVEFDEAPDGRWYPSAWAMKSGVLLNDRTALGTAGFYVVQGQMFPKQERMVSQGRWGELRARIIIKYSDIKFEFKKPSPGK